MASSFARNIEPNQYFRFENLVIASTARITRSTNWTLIQEIIRSHVQAADDHPVWQLCHGQMGRRPAM